MSKEPEPLVFQDAIGNLHDMGSTSRQEEVAVPRLRRSWTETMARLENPSTEPEIVRNLISLIKDVSTYREYSRYRGNRPPILISLTIVCGMVGLYPRSKSRDVAAVADWLDFERVPIGRVEHELKGGEQKGDMQRYFFTTKNFVAEAVRLLKETQDPRLEEIRKPAVRFTGPQPESMPTTGDLRYNREEYSRLFQLPCFSGIKNKSQLERCGASLESLIGENPPVTIFETDGRFFVFKADAEAASEYFEERLSQSKVSLPSK